MKLNKESYLRIEKSALNIAVGLTDHRFHRDPSSRLSTLTITKIKRHFLKIGGLSQIQEQWDNRIRI